MDGSYTNQRRRLAANRKTRIAAFTKTPIRAAGQPEMHRTSEKIDAATIAQYTNGISLATSF
jgi:hypothetical protein